METRANYVAIGAFVIVVLCAAMAALYWFYRSANSGATEVVRIVFPEPVTGLSNGGSVLFNGIRVGEVTRLEFAPEGGDNVIAITRLSQRAPIKTDTVATLSFQGLTGVAYISLSGGSEAAPSLFASTDDDETTPPTIYAATSTFTNVIDSAQNVLRNLNSTLDEVNSLLSSNRSDVNAVVGNVRTFSDALAASGPQISGLIDNISSAADAVATTVPHVTSIVDNANEILTAINPQRVGEIVDNVETFTATLPQISQQAESIVGTVNGLVVRLDDAAGVLGDSIRAAGNVISAIDDQAINEIVQNVRAATSVFSGRSEEIGTLVDNVTVVSGNVRDITETLAGKREAIGQAVDDAGTLIADARGAVAAATPAIESFSRSLEAISPERVTAIIDSVQSISTGLASRTEAFGALIDSATDAAESIDQIARSVAARNAVIEKTIDDTSQLIANLREASNSAPQILTDASGLLQDARGVVSAVNAEAINKVVADVGTFADAMAAQSANIGPLVEAATGVAQRSGEIATALSEKLPQINTFLDNAEAVSTSLRTASADLPGLVASLRPGIDNASAALSALDPEAIGVIQRDVAAVTTALAQKRDQMASLIDNVSGAAGSIDEVATALAARTPQIGEVIDRVDTITASVQTFAASLPEFTDTLRPGIENVANVFASIDPEAVGGIVTNVKSLSDALAAQSPRVEAIVTNADTTLADVSAITARFRSELDTITAGIADAREAIGSARTFAEGLPTLLQRVEPGVTNFSDALGSIDPAAISTIVGNVRNVTETLSQSSEQISAIITTADTVVKQVNEVTQTVSARTADIDQAIDGVAKLGGALGEAAPRVSEIVDGVDEAVKSVSSTLSEVNTEALNDILTDVRTVVSAVAARTGEIGQAIDNISNASRGLSDALGTMGGEDGTMKEILDRAQRIVANLERASEQVGAVMNRANGLLDGPVQGMIANVSNAAGSVNQVAAAFASRADEIASGVGRFSKGGLDDLRTLINQGRSTLASIESTVSSFDRDPSRVIFGGPNGPRYQPQRR
ncbi:MlaD family protein [Acuticoccus sp. M5D2P5]|uniref:MlaD family protein n=1 Tax=Acuticoccus kalidii TaxID=2910977 RepID=UPI001F40D8E4|nr:MlaD family protein [Acuticoccus kalidii]MCF3932829.1 MlaD family protein [Acuticoccus kalidii]